MNQATWSDALEELTQPLRRRPPRAARRRRGRGRSGRGRSARPWLRASAKSSFHGRSMTSAPNERATSTLSSREPVSTTDDLVGHPLHAREAAARAPRRRPGRSCRARRAVAPARVLVSASLRHDGALRDKGHASPPSAAGRPRRGPCREAPSGGAPKSLPFFSGWHSSDRKKPPERSPATQAGPDRGRPERLSDVGARADGPRRRPVLRSEGRGHGEQPRRRFVAAGRAARQRRSEQRPLRGGDLAVGHRRGVRSGRADRGRTADVGRRRPARRAGRAQGAAPTVRTASPAPSGSSASSSRRSSSSRPSRCSSCVPPSIAANASLSSRPDAAGPRGGRSPAEEVDRALFDTRVSLKNGLYEQVLRILEPLAEDPQMLDANQRFEAYLLLAKAHRALGNVEKAQQWSLKATDQAVDRREPAQVFEEAATLADEGRHADARRVLHQLLARADALTGEGRGLPPEGAGARRRRVVGRGDPLGRVRAAAGPRPPFGGRRRDRRSRRSARERSDERAPRRHALSPRSRARRRRSTSCSRTRSPSRAKASR